MRSLMSSIKGQIEPEHPVLFALEFGKFAEYDFVYTLSSRAMSGIADCWQLSAIFSDVL